MAPSVVDDVTCTRAATSTIFGSAARVVVVLLVRVGVVIADGSDWVAPRLSMLQPEAMQPSIWADADDSFGSTSDKLLMTVLRGRGRRVE